MIKNQENTPLMQQYYEIKFAHSDALLLFQVGDFYELFFDDAKQAAAFLGIALTSRGKNKGEPIPLCGFPLHAVDHYLSKLVKGGFKVAICDQLEDPKPGSLVRRGVQQVLTPGTLTDAKLLDERSASYLFSFYPTEDSWGLVFSELLTAQIFITTIPATLDKLLESELIRFFPDEIVIPDGKHAKEFQAYFKKLGYFTTIVHDSHELSGTTIVADWIKKQFTAAAQESLAHNEAMKQALYYFYAYMSKTQRMSLELFTTIFFYKSDDFLILDSATQRNLELIKNAHDGTRTNTLFEVMDCARTAMGSRMIKKWIQRPLVKKEAIVQRQDVVALCVYDISFVYEIEDLLVQVGDIERVVGRIALQRASCADYISLAKALVLIPQFQALLEPKKDVLLLRIIVDHLGDFHALSDLLVRALYDEPHDEYIIKEGFDERLDQMRALVHRSNEQLMELEQKEQQATGIQSLKIRYNNVQGYYIEVTNVNLAAVPVRYKRLQTLVGRERFITTELQTLQYSIEHARKDISSYEQELFNGIKVTVASYVSALRKSAHAIAHVDALLSLARLAYDNGYIRPLFNENRDIIIMQGRHPVVEQALSHSFIPNDTFLTDEQSLWIITGPNMGGKSTYLRQVALMCVMAHIGSFIPAASADIALLDRIFTRLGAADNVAEGKSTFLVEMEETATICTQATEKSLVILDEVGRGTSTFDGLAIAQAVVEHLFVRVRARCLFATHYHELTAMQQTFPAVAVYYAASKKTQAGIVFLYKILRGIADGSFGIEVAKLANLPAEVIDRAATLVTAFSCGTAGYSTIPVKGGNEQMLEVFDENGRLRAENMKLLQEQRNAVTMIDALRGIDFDTLSPKKAFDLLWELKDI
jgi:DNA mismatch repair protein MutS